MGASGHERDAVLGEGGGGQFPGGRRVGQRAMLWSESDTTRPNDLFGE